MPAYTIPPWLRGVSAGELGSLAQRAQHAQMQISLQKQQLQQAAQRNAMESAAKAQQMAQQSEMQKARLATEKAYRDIQIQLHSRQLDQTQQRIAMAARSATIPPSVKEFGGKQFLQVASPGGGFKYQAITQPKTGQSGLTDAQKVSRIDRLQKERVNLKKGGPYIPEQQDAVDKRMTEIDDALKEMKGTVIKGHEFQGGDPSIKDSWKAVESTQTATAQPDTEQPQPAPDEEQEPVALDSED